MGLREPLVVPLAALAGGIAASRCLDFTWRETLLATILLFALSIAALWWVNARAANWAAIAAMLPFGIFVDVLHKPGPKPVIEFTPGETLVLSGCVVQPPALSEDREQFVLELEPHARARVNWYLKEGETAPALHYGQFIELEAKLRSPRNFGNPGAFDMENYLAHQEIYWLASASRKSGLKILQGRCGWRPLGWIYSIREFCVDRLNTIFAADPYALGMSRAVLIGDSARLEKVWADDYRRTGTYHAIVISGIHLTVLGACFLFLFRVIGLPHLTSLAATAAVCWLYAIMTGGGAPVVRSAAGLSLFLLAQYFYRQARILNILAAVAMLFLLVDPDEMFDPSFLLSFLSVALIGALASPILDQTTVPWAAALRQLDNHRRDFGIAPEHAELRVELRLIAETIELATRAPLRWILKAISATAAGVNYLWTMFLVSAVVQTGMLLPMIAYFHRLSITGLTANLLIIPAMNMLVPVGFLAILTGLRLFAAPSAWLLAFSRSVTAWHMKWEPGWRIPDPPLWLSALFLAAIILLAITLRLRRYRLPAVGICTVSLAVLLIHPFRQQTEKGLLEVTSIDVGQGDSLLLASPEGRLMLFDTGGFPPMGKQKKPSLDLGEDVISTYLFTRSIKRVEVVALSHAHEDHIGGLLSVVRNFRPREVWIGAFPDTENWLRMRAEVEALGAEIISPKAGEKRKWGGVQIEIMSPPGDYEPGASAKNNDSLAFTIRYGQSSMLLTGDIEKQMEYRMLDDGRLRHVDVLKVAHHGSKTSSTRQFLQAVHPTWAVISAGAGNLFRHPHPQTLKALDQENTQVWRTDLNGQVRFLTDGRRWRIEPFWGRGKAFVTGAARRSLF